jgi:DNA repair protein RadC
MISPREFYREALRYGAYTAIAFHNHPSGNSRPSSLDQALTKRLREAGESLGVKLTDHIIVGSGEYYSFRESEGDWENDGVKLAIASE